MSGKGRKKPKRAVEDDHGYVDRGYIEPYSEQPSESYAAPHAQQSQGTDDGKPTQAQVRERRRARRERQAIRQARQDSKSSGGSS